MAAISTFEELRHRLVAGPRLLLVVRDLGAFAFPAGVHRFRVVDADIFYEVTDIYLFDSKGYEKSMAFDHTLIEKIKINKPLMIAGNIQVNDNLDNFKKIADIIDISGGLETSGVKDKSKIDIFLNKVEQVKNET